MDEKEKDTIILKSILKINNTTENKYIYVVYTMRKTIIYYETINVQIKGTCYVVF